ncbi:MAG: M13 family metallopeptidase [Bacteroidetes bacterium]|nr:M13 family metallopeptidase [Bacteroidota bacterium]
MKTLLPFFLPLAFVATFSSCNPDEQAATSNNAIDTTNFDKSVRAQDDFYQYVNGTWLKNNPVPSSENSWGAFNILADKSKKDLRAICEESAKGNNPAGSNAEKIGDFYSSGMDSVAVENAKFAPIQEYLDHINAIKDLASLNAEIAELHSMEMSAGFSMGITADMKDSKTNALYVGQSGTFLPEKEYYFSEETKPFREAYKVHLLNMFKLMGDDEMTAKKNGEAVFQIESMLADSSMSAEEERDLEKMYNKMSKEDLMKLCPDFDWNTYFTALGIPAVNFVIVTQPSFLRQFNHMLKSTPLDAWKAYLRFALVHNCAPALHSAVANENFNFFGTMLSGIQKQQERWKRVLGNTQGALNEALGQIYVQKHFSQEAKDRVNGMVTNLIAAYKERIQSRDWMSDATKKSAFAKLESILRKLAFPDKWRDYSGLMITKDSYMKNILNGNIFDMKFNISKLSKPVDRMEWGMSPATINAYYNPSNNEIVFPAAIMQPPFFDPNADDAVNYGAMGAVIGHELTHGFDDQGSMYDADGNMKNWWTTQDSTNFKNKTEKLAAQFDQFVAVDSMQLHVNGHLTNGENIADLGGLTISYYAFKKSLEGKPEPAKICGFTAEQRFFLAWAQAWRTNQKTKAVIFQVKTNPHAPARFRVLGPLSNLQEFYDAFGVKEGDKMYRKPEDRVLIW